ncbi:MAG: hypothetical protein N2749_03465 [Clostridia bacterium]|nr:hypothetical protein [Clostridia bacterium]
MSPKEEKKYFFEVFERRITRVPNGFWNSERTIRAVRILFKNYLKYDKKTICKSYDAKFLSKYGIRSARKFYSLYELIKQAFPEHNFMPWELKKVKCSGWTDELIVYAIKWLVETIRKLTPDEAIKVLTRDDFDSNNLSYIYKINGRDNKKVIRLAYPNLAA